MTKSLQHWGIPGMRWGIRRSRSPAVDSSSSDHKTARSISTKKISEMSNEDLKKLTTRLQLEKQYKDLSKPDISAGKKFTSDVLTNVGKQLASDFVKDSLKGVTKSLFDILVKGQDPGERLKSSIDKLKNLG